MVCTKINIFFNFLQFFLRIKGEISEKPLIYRGYMDLDWPQKMNKNYHFFQFSSINAL